MPKIYYPALFAVFSVVNYLFCFFFIDVLPSYEMYFFAIMMQAWLFWGFIALAVVLMLIALAMYHDSNHKAKHYFISALIIAICQLVFWLSVSNGNWYIV